MRLGTVSLRPPRNEEPFGEADEPVQHEGEQAEENDTGEDARGVESGLGLDDLEAETCGGAGPLAEDRADCRVRGRDAGAGEDRRQSTGQLDPAKDRPAVGV